MNTWTPPALYSTYSRHGLTPIFNKLPLTIIVSVLITYFRRAEWIGNKGFFPSFMDSVFFLLHKARLIGLHAHFVLSEHFWYLKGK